jgi:hypothetical protein
MKKKNPPTVGDADILAYLEGLASPDVKAEIEASPRLLARARQLAREEARLRLFLAPAEDENDLELLQPSLLERVRFEMAQLIRSGGAAITKQGGAIAPQPAPVRGMPIEQDQINQQATKLAFETDELFIGVEIDFEADNSQQFELRGYVLGWDEYEAQASFWCDNTLLQTVTLDDENEFFVDHLFPGDYQIVITTPNRCIVLESFSIS